MATVVTTPPSGEDGHLKRNVFRVSNEIYVACIVDNGGTSYLGMFKSSNGGSSFAEVDAANRPTRGGVRTLSACKVGNYIWVIANNGITNHTVVSIFNTSTDAWYWGTGYSSGGFLQIGNANVGQNSNENCCFVDCVADPNGIIHFAFSLQYKTMGQPYLRVRYIRADASSGPTDTFSSALTVVADTTIDQGMCSIALILKSSAYIPVMCWDDTGSGYQYAEGNSNNPTSFSVYTVLADTNQLSNHPYRLVSLVPNKSTGDIWYVYKTGASGTVTIYTKDETAAYNAGWTSQGTYEICSGSILDLQNISIGSDVYNFGLSNVPNIIAAKNLSAAETVLQTSAVASSFVLGVKWGYASDDGAASQIDYVWYNSSGQLVWDAYSLGTVYNDSVTASAGGSASQSSPGINAAASASASAGGSASTSSALDSVAAVAEAGSGTYTSGSALDAVAQTSEAAAGTEANDGTITAIFNDDVVEAAGGAGTQAGALDAVAATTEAGGGTATQAGAVSFDSGIAESAGGTESGAAVLDATGPLAEVASGTGAQAGVVDVASAVPASASGSAAQAGGLAYTADYVEAGSVGADPQFLAASSDAVTEESNAVNTGTIHFATVNVGDLVLVNVQRATYNDNPAVTLGTQNMTALGTAHNADDGSSFYEQTWACIADANGAGSNVAATATFTGSNPWLSMSGARYSGVASATPLAIACGNTGCLGRAASSTNLQYLQITTTERALIVVSGTTYNNYQTVTGANGYTKRYDNTTWGGSPQTVQFVVDKVADAGNFGGTETVATVPVSDQWLGHIIAFEISAGGGGVAISETVSQVKDSAGAVPSNAGGTHAVASGLDAVATIGETATGSEANDGEAQGIFNDAVAEPAAGTEAESSSLDAVAATSEVATGSEASDATTQGIFNDAVAEGAGGTGTSAGTLDAGASTSETATATESGGGALVAVAAIAEVIAGAGGGSTIPASSPSEAHVAAAIAAASPGDTVTVPAGSGTWNTLAIAKAIKLQGAGIGQTNITLGSGNGITKQAAGVIRITGFSFSKTSGGNESHGFSIDGSWLSAEPILIYGNEFTISGSGLFQIGTPGGVIIANNDFTCGVDDSLIRPKDQSDTYGSWTTADSMGMNDTDGKKNIYIETNTFYGGGNQAVDADDASRVVYRYNEATYSSFNSHGYATSPYGVRHWEVYNNTFLYPAFGGSPPQDDVTNMSWFLWLRGAEGVIHNNSIADINSGWWGDKNEIIFNIRAIQDQYITVFGSCGAISYPAPRQIGQGHNGSSPITAGCYIWSNTGTFVIDASLNGSWGNPCGVTFSDFWQESRDYFFSAKPGYTPYTYPHPLLSEGTGGAGESVAATLDAIAAASESATGSEASDATAAPVYNDAVAESAGGTHAAGSALDAVGPVAETSGGSAAVGSALDGTGGIAESAGAQSASGSAFDGAGGISEAAGAGEAIDASTLGVWFVAIAEGATALAAAASVLDAVSGVSEAAGAGESTTGGTEQPASGVAESAGASATVAAFREAVGSVIEVTAAAAAVQEALEAIGAVSEGGNMADAYGSLLTALAAASEAVLAASDLAGALAVDVTVLDQAGVASSAFAAIDQALVNMNVVLRRAAFAIARVVEARAAIEARRGADFGITSKRDTEV